MNVAPASVHTNPPDDVDTDIAKTLVFPVGQCESRRHGDRIAGVNADRVDVFDRAHHHHVVGVVTHELEFVLFPAQDGLFQQHFMGWRLVKTITHHSNEVVFGVGKTGTEPTHGEGGADNQRITQFFRIFHSLIDACRDEARRNICSRGNHQVFELLTIFPALNRLKRGSNEFDPVLVKNPLFVQRNSRIERRLSSQGGKDCVGAFLLNDGFDHIRLNGFDVGSVRKTGVRHDGGRVGVHQHHPDTLLLENPAGLGPGIVKLRCLPDDNRARPDDEHSIDVIALRHSSLPPRECCLFASPPCRGNGRRGRSSRGARLRLPGDTAPRRQGDREREDPRRRCHSG